MFVRSASGVPSSSCSLGALRHRKRLAGQRGFVRSKIGGLNQPRVGRHAAAEVELDDVARHDRRRIDSAELSRPNDRGFRHVELQQRLHRAPRPKLRDETDDCVDGEDGRNRHRLDAIAECERNSDGRNQQVDDDALELIGEDAQRRGRLAAVRGGWGRRARARAAPPRRPGRRGWSTTPAASSSADRLCH